MRKIAITITVLVLSAILYSCGESQNNVKVPSHNDRAVSPDTTSHNHANNEATIATLYGCPMHKEMIGAKGDECPKCDYMEMVPVTWSLKGVDTVRVTTLPDYKP